jgi:hypothetical protein
MVLLRALQRAVSSRSYKHSKGRWIERPRAANTFPLPISLGPAAQCRAPGARSNNPRTHHEFACLSACWPEGTDNDTIDRTTTLFQCWLAARGDQSDEPNERGRTDA